MTSSAVVVVVAVLAVYRVTRLVTGDYITETPRRWLQRHLPEKLAYLIGCPHCASFWIAIPVSWAAIFHMGVSFPGNRWLWVGMLTLAGSAVAGQLSNLEHYEDLGTVDGTQPAAGVADE